MNVPVRSTSTTAIVSLVFGIACWFVLPFIGAVVAVLCGHAARGEIRRAPPGSLDGDGMAVAGLVLGYVHLAFFVVTAMLLLMFFGGLSWFVHWFHAG